MRISALVQLDCLLLENYKSILIFVALEAHTIGQHLLTQVPQKPQFFWYVSLSIVQ